MEAKRKKIDHMPSEGYEETHPSYAMAAFIRSSGGHHVLFGSSIKHTEKIKLEIYRAERQRNLSEDWYHSREKLIEVEMSPSQFADLITIHNTSGHPVTLSYFNGEEIPDCPFNDTRREIEEEFEQKCRGIAKDAGELVAKIKSIIGGPIKVADRKEITKALDMLMQEINSNLPFMQEQFNRAIDKTTSAAKQEVEAFFTTKLQSLGLLHLKNAIEESVPVIPQIEEKK